MESIYKIELDLQQSLGRMAMGAGRVVEAVKRYKTLFESLEALSPSSNIWFDCYDVNISLTGSREVLNSAFHLLRTAGFEPEARAEEGHPEYRSRFKHVDGAVVYFSFSSTVCKRVQVGTRTVEQPIYEIRCEEDAPAEADSASEIIPPPPAPEAPAQEIPF